MLSCIKHTKRDILGVMCWCHASDVLTSFECCAYAIPVMCFRHFLWFAYVIPVRWTFVTHTAAMQSNRKRLLYTQQRTCLQHQITTRRDTGSSKIKQQVAETDWPSTTADPQYLENRYDATAAGSAIEPWSPSDSRVHRRWYRSRKTVYRQTNHPRFERTPD